MKNKLKIFIILITFMISLSGCQLANPTQSNNDRFIGFLLTSNELFTDNIETNRLYASYDKSSNLYHFEDTEDIYIIAKYTSYNGEEGIEYMANSLSNVNFSSASSDQDLASIMKATLYTTNESNEIEYYFNPIYQDSNYDIYAVSGLVYSLEGDSLLKGSRKFEKSSSIDIGGKITNVIIEIEIEMETMIPPLSINIIQMSEDNKVISVNNYQTENTPDSITIYEETEYLIVEEIYNEDISQNYKTAYDYGSEYIESFNCHKNKACELIRTTIIW